MLFSKNQKVKQCGILIAGLVFMLTSFGAAAQAPSKRTTSSRTPVKVGTLKSMGANKIETVSGKKISLKRIAKDVFTKQNSFAQTLQKQGVKQKALLNKPIQKSEVVDLGKTYELTQSVTFTIIDGDKFSSLSKDMGVSFPKRPQKNVKRLSAKEKKMLNTIIADAAKLDEKDPIRIASTQGQQAVLDALREGKGTVTLSETIEIPKEAIIIKDGYVQLPTVTEDSIRFDNVVPVKAAVNEEALKKVLQSKAVISTPVSGPSSKVTMDTKAITQSTVLKTLEPSRTIGGEDTFTLELLMGKTYGTAWRWEKKWDLGAGFFRLTVGCSLAAGFRVPVTVTGKVNPIVSDVVGERDVNTRVTTEFQVDTLDADSAYYRRAGLSESDIYDGDEFVFHISVGMGYKFYYAGVDWVHQKFKSNDLVNYSQDFKAPFGNGPQDGIDFAIPQVLTKSGFNLDILSGGVTFGVFLTGQGEFSLEKSELENGKTLEHKEVTFTNNNPRSFVKKYSRFTQNNTTYFGIRLDQFNYTMKRLQLIPEFKLEFHINHDLVSFHETSSWRRISALALEMPGGFSFVPHDGTKRRYVWQNGRKSFTKIEPQANNDSSTPKQKNTNRTAVRRRSH